MNSNFEKYKDLIENSLNDFLNSEILSSKSKSCGTFPHSLFEQLNYILSAGGKRIRPLLVLLSCDAFNGNINNSLNAAVSVELLHNFTLVHDDIMDNAATRRGRQTIHYKWDTNSAILVGDELIGLSYRCLLKTESINILKILNVFTEGVIEVCEGQALDKQFENSDNVNIDDYILMIRKKTAELLRTSALIGALIADADEYQLSMISSYAENIGIAFQIQDDLLDVIADQNEFGKKIGGDILEKKRTYLYLKSLELLSGDEKNKFCNLYNSDNSEKVDKIINFYRNLCVIESAKEKINFYTQIANKNLDNLNNEKISLLLGSFSNMLLNRSF